jgi:hypothetical protein
MKRFFKIKNDMAGYLWNYIAILLSFVAVCILSGGNFFKKYTPRKTSLFNESNLIFVHFLGNILIATTSIVIAFILFFFVVKGKEFPSRYIYFLFSVFLLFFGLCVIADGLAIWVNFSWIYGSIKIGTGVIGVIIVANMPKIVTLMLRLGKFNDIQEYREVRQKLHDTKNSLQKAYLQIEELANKINDRSENDDE